MICSFLFENGINAERELEARNKDMKKSVIQVHLLLLFRLNRI